MLKHKQIRLYKTHKFIQVLLFTLMINITRTLFCLNQEAF